MEKELREQLHAVLLKYFSDRGPVVRTRCLTAIDAVLSTRPIVEQAADLIRNAEAQRKVVTIQTKPLLPLAMGNYKMVADVRDARVRA